MRLTLLRLLVIGLPAASSLGGAGSIEEDNYSKQMDKALIEGVSSRVFPGVSAAAGTLDGRISYFGSFGSYKYFLEEDGADDDIPNMRVNVDSIFDLASVSKVVAGTTAVALLYEKGYLNLDTLVQDVLGAAFAQGGKENVTIRNCLLHNAGFLPDPDPLYWSTTFGCSNTYMVSNDTFFEIILNIIVPSLLLIYLQCARLQEYPAEDFSCLEEIWNSFLGEELVTEPGAAFKYSDLSFITLASVVGSIVRSESLVASAQMLDICSSPSSEMQQILCHYEAFVRTNIFQFQVCPPSISQMT